MLQMPRTQSRTAQPRSAQPAAAARRTSSGIAPDDLVDGIEELSAAIRTLKTTDEVTRFLRDLCTRAELEALVHRWQTARLLEQGVPYLEIAERVPTSTATVTRVAQWVRHGAGGYRIALDRMAKRR